MSQSLVKNLMHLVYSTKHRNQWIPKTVKDNLYAYQAGIFKQWDSPALVIGGVEDHIHVLVSLSKNHPLKQLVEETKKGSSKWMKTDGSKNKDFHWQNGYAAFSVSQSNVEEVRRYIENQ
jgi:putative transposase